MAWSEHLLQLLFPEPRKCPICGSKQERLQVCADCHRQLLYKRSQYGQCQRCHSFGSRAAACINCRKWPDYFTGNYSAWPYQEEYRDAVMAFKFSRQPWLAEAFAREMLPLLPAGYDLLVPVPLHRTRLRERGYNQSQLLAKELSKMSGIPWKECLLRVEATRHQAELSRSQRRENLRQAFAVTHQEAVAGKKIIIIDDIFTTGATVCTCASKLKAAGAREIAAVTLAAGMN